MQEQRIQIDDRFADFVRSQAMSDVYDALVEIITNSDDSYHHLYEAQERAEDGGSILIEIAYRRGSPSLVVVKDRAEGMTLEAMRTKLGRMGARTSEEGDRGFMARGLKDCTFLGDITVNSIFGGKHYACQLTRKFKFVPLADGEKVTETLRRELGIEKKNGTGTVVKLEYSVKVPLPNIDTIRRALPTHYALRDILASDGPSKVSIRKAGEDRLHPLTLGAFPGELIVDQKNIPVMGYPKADFRLRLWRASEPFRDHDSPRLRKSGVVIKGRRAIHQCTLFDCEREDLAKHYHGRIDCPYIDRLLDEYDKRRAEDEVHPADNPTLVVDPNRQRGLNVRQHPFARMLFKQAGTRLKELVERDRRELSKSSGDVTDAEMRRRLGDLAKATDRFWRENVEEDELSPESDAFNAALESGMYVLPPGFKIEVGEERTLTAYFRRTLYDEKIPTRVRTGDGSVIAVTRSLAKQVAKPHRKREDIVCASFKVKGVKEGETTISVVHGDLASAEARGAVVPERDPSAPEYESPLGFQRKRYDIAEGASKTLLLFADWPAVVEHGVNVHVKSDDPARVPVMKGGECVLTRKSGTDYAEGEIKVEGRGITQSPVVITAGLGDLPFARAKVSVKEKKHSGGGFDYQLRDESNGVLRAWWAELEGKPKLLIISSIHSSIKPYADRQRDPAARVLMAELIAEAVCNKLLRYQMRTQPGTFQRKLEEKEPYEVLDAVNEELHKRVNEFAAIAHKILVGDLGKKD